MPSPRKGEHDPIHSHPSVSLFADCRFFNFRWQLERQGHTRSHPEHGRQA